MSLEYNIGQCGAVLSLFVYFERINTYNNIRVIQCSEKPQSCAQIQNVIP